MRLILAFCLFIITTWCFVAYSWASDDQRLIYSGTLMQQSTAVDATIDIKFILYSTQDSHEAIWQETHDSVRIKNGHFTVELGEKSSLDPILDGKAYWLEIEINHEKMSPRTAFGAVPFALRAGQASQTDGIDVQALTDTITQLESTIEALLHAQTELQRRVDILDTKTIDMQRFVDEDTGIATVAFSGVNVQIDNGHSDQSTTTTNGTGNLMIGFNEERTYDTIERGGSHNLIIGRYHNYPGFSSLVAGESNDVGQNSVVFGSANTATGNYSVTLGGATNLSSSNYSTVVGGIGNNTSKVYSTIVGTNRVSMDTTTYNGCAMCQ